MVLNPDELPDNEKIRPVSRYERIIKYKKRKLTKEDVLIAMANTKSNRAAARFLGANYLTYRKYAKLFLDDDGISLYEKHKNQSGAGIKKYPSVDRKYFPLVDILAGKYPDYNPVRLKTRLIQEGYLPEKCANCGFNHRRLVDNKNPLILNFIDNNITNFKLENLELLCYNCYYLLVGNFMNPYHVYKYPRLTDYPDLNDQDKTVYEG